MSGWRKNTLRYLLWLIILIEIAFGILYAVKTPRWQAPDEPAQFNYVRHIAETGTLPILQKGDYDQAYLEKIKAAKFPLGMSVDNIRYESYQPPLYYLLATPVYLGARAVNFDLALALRLCSVSLGALLFFLAYRVLAQIFPANPWLALAGVGFMATVPMHIAMASAINADVLAEVLVAVILLIAFARTRGNLNDRRFILLGGIVYGLALLASTKIYPAALLLVFAEIGYIIQGKSEGGKRGMEFANTRFVGAWRVLFLLFGVAVLVSGWWFVRNALIYGDADILGWARHDIVVTGQPTTAEWAAKYGLKSIAADFFIITFKSFWAQFGWMSVLVNDRIYVSLFVLTATVMLGLVLWVIRVLRERAREWSTTQLPWLLCGVWLLTVFLAHAWYNLRYVQPQGRYLFPALLPVAAFFVVGLYEIFDKRYTRLILGALYIVMLGLDYVSLYWFIIPQLRV